MGTQYRRNTSIFARYQFMHKVKKVSDISIFFSPRLPDVRHSIWRIVDVLGLKISSLAQEGHIGFLGDGSTFCKPVVATSPEMEIINGQCLDIGKSRVDSCFRAVFGYSVELDPLAFEGVGVRKSEHNFMHDGVITQFPIERREEGYVYNKLINNYSSDDVSEILDLRVPIVGSRIPFVYKRYRPTSRRFENIDSKVILAETNDIFSLHEVKNIICFCKEMNFDFGELDILRNNDENGLIYIIDANRTPASPPRQLSIWAGHCSMIRMSRIFAEEFLTPFLEEQIISNESLSLPKLYQFHRPVCWLKSSIRAILRIVRGKYASYKL